MGIEEPRSELLLAHHQMRLAVRNSRLDDKAPGQRHGRRKRRQVEQLVLVITQNASLTCSGQLGTH